PSRRAASAVGFNLLRRSTVLTFVFIDAEPELQAETGLAFDRGRCKNRNDNSVGSTIIDLRNFQPVRIPAIEYTGDSARAFKALIKLWRSADTQVGSAHLGCCIENSANDLVVACAAAKVAGEPVAHLGFGRVRVAIEQRFRGDQHAGRAEAALQRGVLEKFLLQWVEIVTPRNALDSLDRFAFGLDRKHEA